SSDVCRALPAYLDLYPFPTRRSSDLAESNHPRSGQAMADPIRVGFVGCGRFATQQIYPNLRACGFQLVACCATTEEKARRWAHEDRKSTRLNSSHEWTSYAVFCLKKK